MMTTVDTDDDDDGEAAEFVNDVATMQPLRMTAVSTTMAGGMHTFCGYDGKVKRGWHNHT